MASSGSFSGSIRDGHYKLRVDWSQSTNVSANTSTVTCKLYLVNDWSLNISGRSDNTCTIDGSAQTFSSPAISSTGTHLLGTVSRTVNHASDGGKSLTISAVFQIRATLSGTYYGTITASANITLDSIPRASSVSAGNMTLGSVGKINISRASSSFTHTLTYSFGNTSGTIATKTTATSVSWTPSLSLANQIPNATSGTCTITCTTYNGNTNIGAKTCTLSLSVPASVKPTISSLSAARIDGEVPSAWGIYVQTKSKVKLTINGAAGSYGSTIKSYSITGGGYSGSASTLTTGFLNNSGTITFKATVTDSRGRVSAEASVSITVTAYSPPYFNSSLSQRCLSNGTLDDDGTYIHALVSFGYSTCGGKNTLKTSVQYKQVSAEQWTDAGVTFASNTAFTYGKGQISTETSYDVRYTLEDAFSTISIQEIVSTAAVVMDFKSGGKGVAVGKVSERDNTFEVAENWDIRVYGKLLRDFVYPVGSIYLSVKNTDPAMVIGGTWERIAKGSVLVGVNESDASFSTPEKAGGAKSVSHTHTTAGHKLTASEIPAHSHSFKDGSHTMLWGTKNATVNAPNANAAAGAPSQNQLCTRQNVWTGTNNTGGGGSHTHGNTGSTSISTLQPYVTCYMWKRTA